MRENVINRIYDQNVGYWQPDLQGVDYLSRADRGSVLVDYLGISERQLVRVVERMIADGNYELAATTLEWTKGRFAGSKSLDDARRLTYLKLMEKYQEFNPFKFIIYFGANRGSSAAIRIEAADTERRSSPLWLIDDVWLHVNEFPSLEIHGHT